MIIKTVKFLLIAIASLALITYIFMLQPSFGRLPSGSRLERIQKSPQYNAGVFKNIHETRLLAQGASYFGMVTKFFRKGKDREPINSLPSVKTGLKSLSEEAQIVWFGHSSFLISIASKKILADPVFSDRPSPVQYAGSKSYAGTRIYSAEDFPGLDIIIISHDHYDHLDYGSITQLNSKTKLFCVPLGVGEHLERWGVEPSKIREFDWWEGDTFDGVQVTCTPARHFSGRGFTNNKTLWASFVVKVGDKSIFIGGDSGYDDSFKKIGDAYGPFDIAMLECGQYDVQWPAIHMMPEETVQASIDLRAKVFLPVHWAKFTLALHPWKDPIERVVVRARSLEVNVTTPKIGEPIIFGQPFPSSTWWSE